MNPKFIHNEPALIANGSLVIADLHIGIEYEFLRSGIRVPSNTENMKKRIFNLLKKTNAEKLIILGDLKHKVPGMTKQELREIPEFLEFLSKEASIEIVPGNHDSGISGFLPKNIKLHRSSGFLFGEFYFVHGHSWPDKKFLNARYVIVGHDHPVIEIRDKMGYRFIEQVWLEADLNPKKIAMKYKLKNKDQLPKLIVMPAFNQFSGGIAINRQRTNSDENDKQGLGPLVRASEIENADVYLLEGLFIGKLKEI